MPPQSTFRNQGSLDEYQGEMKGHEFVRIMKYFSNKALLVFTIIFAVFGGVMPLLMNLFMGDMVNVMAEGNDFLKRFKPIIFKLIGFTCAQCAVMGINMQLRFTANPFFMRDLRSNLFRAFLEKDIDYYDLTPTGVMVGRISQDVTLVHEIFIDKLCTALQMLAQSIGGIILSLCTMWQAALIGIGAVCVAGCIYYFGDKIVDRIWVEYNESASAAASKAEEIITSFRTIKSFDCELKESEIFKSQLVSVDNVFKKTSIAQGVKDGLISVVLNGLQAGVLYFASWMIQTKPKLGYEPGDLFIILMSLSFATLGISSALTLSDDFKKTTISASKLLDIIETPPKVDRKVGDSLRDVKGKIEFRDVTFKYATAKTNAVQHLSFVINPGETVAFVGESGCGKSTTLQLIQRFYEIDDGMILLDDVDMRTLSPMFIRSQIAIVPQSPVLYSMSILDNIRYANPENTTDAEVAEAARIGNAHNFIMEMPQNYKSEVQQTSLSGGQKQRICISRAIVAHTPILLLDEATAALDTESERLVQQSLETFRQGKTAILVAHRLATVMNADRILVFSEGRVVEEGNHQQLIAKGGIYADLVKFQLQ
ncbi:hypothetical protein M9Y10_006244 [Tritrichomonas musculus]|uniref:ABC transporter family protein n=1 Tax=Tritrichomonas musculus TaxID=1915356 RepID=A0ABR2JE66_9EUKA